MTILTSLRRFFRLYPFRSEVVDDGLPLPRRAFRWYLWFWHIFYLGALAVISGYTLWAARAALGWREAALVALVAAQVALYVWNFILNDRWPLPAWRHAVYFLGSMALWLIEWRLYSGYLWLGMTYLGQMFGVLPPLGAIPGTALVLFFFYGQGLNWDFSRLSVGEIVGPVLGWVSFIVLYLFIYTITRTSEERAGLIRQLQATQRELELARAHDAELAALRERERLARDLHDSLGHALVAISVQLEAIQRLYRVDPQRATEQVEALKGVTRASMDELRRSLLGLRSAGLGDRPLPEALRTLGVETGQRTGLNVACHVSEDAQRLTPAAAETLWRVAQEALTNVEKHSQARQVEIGLEVGPAGAVLRVSDDGRGLPAGAETLPEHYGLRGMRERVEGLGGTLTLDPRGHTGTLVEARLPVV